MILFMGIMDRAPVAGEGDIVLDGQQLMECAGHL